MSGSDYDSDKAIGPKPAGFKFGEGQRVFCFHGPVMYESKCIKIEAKDGLPHYLIHYHGWNKSWDEWVTEERVREYSHENVREAARLRDLQKIATKEAKGKRKSFGSNTSVNNAASPIVERETEVSVKQTGGKESSGQFVFQYNI